MAWTIGNFYLNQEQMEGNAYEVFSFLSARGWTTNAIAGILGNMQSESNINPGVWQNLDSGNYSLGFGLVQWTPATNYTNWASANGYNITDPEGQLRWIDEVTVSAGQWIPTSGYNFSFDTFKHSTESPEYLASAFLKNFERAGVEVENERRTQARSWYDYISQFDASTVIEAAIAWALATAADNSHGYSQASRWGPDYDCSSFATQSYREAGVDIGGGSGVYTGNMLQYYTEVGFEAVYDVNFSTQEGLMRGDVLLNTVHHTAIYLGNGRIVQASSDRGNPQTGDQTGTEIWETGYYDYPWDVVLRYKGGGGTPPEPVGLYITRFIPA